MTQQNANRNRKKQAGFSLAEVALVVMIAAVIVAAALVYIPRILAEHRAGQIITEFNTDIPTIQKAYTNRGSFNGLTTALVAQMGWMSSTYIERTGGTTPTGNLNTKWGAIQFATTAADVQAQVTLNNIPSSECTKITEMFGDDQYLTASINGTAIKNLAAATTVDFTAGATQCNSTSTNTIVFTFGR